MIRRASWLLFALAACGWPATYDPHQPAQLVPDACVLSAVNGRVWAAAQMGAHWWDPLGGHMGETQGPSIPLRCLSEPEQDNVAAEWDGQAVWLSPDAWNLDPELQQGPQLEASIASITAHELGHAMGMVHTPADLNSEMFPAWTSKPPDATDAKQLCSLWGPSLAACAF